ncbi:MAG: hypothetical protein DMD91_22200 [Candidatus Rokuibacteriota bacterium]|nr:MAG: hypothetical protein DMD91_22200 [Candidatus Rokubacteria bacterium]
MRLRVRFTLFGRRQFFAAVAYICRDNPAARRFRTIVPGEGGGDLGLRDRTVPFLLTWAARCGLLEGTSGGTPGRTEGRELESEALKLSRRARARLAQRLISSLDQEMDADAEKLWLAEAERRLGELKSGKVAGIAAAKVIRKARSTLR